MPAATSAIEQLWSEHAAAVWAYAARRVGRSDAEEIVADTFVVALRRSDEPPVAHPRAWLFGVARNLIRERRRAFERRRAATDRLAGRRVADLELPEVFDSELRRALLTLTDDDRELLLLVAWDGLAPSEAGCVVGLRPSTARMRLLRVRRAMRGMLDQQHDGVNQEVT